MSSTRARNAGSSRSRGCGRSTRISAATRPGIGREDEDAVAHQHRFLDIMGDDQDRLDRHPPLGPEIEQIGAQRLGGQHVERREGLVHQQQRRVHDDRSRQPDALPHPARQFLRVGVLEAVQADQVDRGERAAAALLRGHALRLQPQFDILQHGEPGEEREGLEDHAHRRCRAFLVRDEADRALVGSDQSGDRAQQRGLARARAAEQADHFVLEQGQVDIVENQQAAAPRLAITVADMLDRCERAGGGDSGGAGEGGHGRNSLFERDQASRRRRSAKR